MNSFILLTTSVAFPLYNRRCHVQGRSHPAVNALAIRPTPEVIPGPPKPLGTVDDVKVEVTPNILHHADHLG